RRRGCSIGPSPRPRSSIQAASLASGASSAQSWSPPGTIDAGCAACCLVSATETLALALLHVKAPTIPGMSLQRQYEEDGVVLLKDALDPASLASAQEAYEWSLANPGPGASRLPQKGGRLPERPLQSALPRRLPRDAG